MVYTENAVDSKLFSENQKELVDVIGLTAYQKLVKYYGGSSIYISKSDTTDYVARNAEIRRKFDGANYRQLAIEYNLSTNRVRTILGRKKK